MRTAIEQGSSGAVRRIPFLARRLCRSQSCGARDIRVVGGVDAEIHNYGNFTSGESSQLKCPDVAGRRPISRPVAADDGLRSTNVNTTLRGGVTVTGIR